MKTIKIKCDRCGKEQTFTADRHGTFKYRSLSIHQVHIYKEDCDGICADLCDDCYLKFINFKEEEQCKKV